MIDKKVLVLPLCCMLGIIVIKIKRRCETMIIEDGKMQIVQLCCMLGIIVIAIVAGYIFLRRYIDINFGQKQYITSDGRVYTNTEVVKVNDNYYIEDDNGDLIKIDVVKITDINEEEK